MQTQNVAQLLSWQHLVPEQGQQGQRAAHGMDLELYGVTALQCARLLAPVLSQNLGTCEGPSGHGCSSRSFSLTLAAEGWWAAAGKISFLLA